MGHAVHRQALGVIQLFRGKGPYSLQWQHQLQRLPHREFIPLHAQQAPVFGIVTGHYPGYLPPADIPPGFVALAVFRRAE